MDYDIEKRTDEILEALGKELLASRMKYADAVLDGETPPFLVEETFRKRARKRRMVRRALILVAVLVMLMGLAIVSVDGVKERVFNFFSSVQPGHTDIVPLDESKEESEIPNFELGYLPEGYEEISVDSDKISIRKEYVNETEDYIYFDVYASKYHSVSVDNDTLVQEQVRVSIYQAQLFSDDNDAYIIWQVGDYTLSISGPLDKETMLEIANSVELKE